GSPLAGEVERIVLKKVKFTNTETWKDAMTTRERTVCRVEAPENTGVGTGFLLGPGVAMTNYHVLEKVIQKKEAPETVVFRFDYKTTADGFSLNDGTLYRLAAKDWLLDHSPVAEFDYALVQLAGEPGKQPLDELPGKPARGWLTPAAAATF